MSGQLLAGPFLTRVEVAQLLGVPRTEVVARHDLLRIGGRFLEEVYFDFQFNGGEVRRDIGTVVLAMRRRCDDATIADWLVRSNDGLHGETPLRWLGDLGRLDRVLELAADYAPPPEDVATPEPRVYARPEMRTRMRQPYGRWRTAGFRHVPAH